MKILIAEPMSPAAIDLFRKQEGWQIIVSNPKEYEPHLAAGDAMVVRSAVKVKADTLAKAPNLRLIGRAGVGVDDRGFIGVDTQMRTNQPHIFAIGDIVGQPMLAHKAVHEAHVAAEAAAGQKSHFDAKVIPSVAYTDPEIAWVGVTEAEAASRGMKIGKSVFPWAASGTAIANGRDEGFTKLIFDGEIGRGPV